MQHGERLQERVHRIHARHARALEQRAHELVGAGERRGVGEHHPLRDARASGLHRDHRLARFTREPDGRRERRRIRHALDVQPDRGDFLAPRERAERVVEVELQPVAQRDDIGDRQSALLHREVEREIRRHGDERHARRHAPAALLIRPEHGPVDIVDEPVGVRPDQRHVTSRLQQPPLQLGAFLARLGEAAREADRAPGAALGERAHDVDAPPSVDGHVGGVGSCGKLGHGAVDAAAAHPSPGGMDGPDAARKRHAVAFVHDRLGRAATEDGDALGAEQAYPSHCPAPPRPRFPASLAGRVIQRRRCPAPRRAAPRGGIFSRPPAKEARLRAAPAPCIRRPARMRRTGGRSVCGGDAKGIPKSEVVRDIRVRAR